MLLLQLASVQLQVDAAIVSKEVPMRDTIIPTWTQIAKASATTAKLSKVKKFWSVLKKADLAKYQSYVSTRAQKKAVKKKVTAYYAAAQKCLEVTLLLNLDRKKSVVLDKLDNVQPSYSPATTPPAVTPVVYLSPEPTYSLATTSPELVPTTTPPYVDVPIAPIYTPALTPSEPELTISSTEIPQVLTAPPSEGTPTASDTLWPNYIRQPATYAQEISEPLPTAPPSEGTPTASDTLWPNYIRQPATYAQEISEKTLNQGDARRPDYRFSPASPFLPPFIILDFDEDGVVTQNDWMAYVELLQSMAHAAATRAIHEEGKEFLNTIIEFHYENLEACIANFVGERGLGDLSEREFTALAPQIEAQCAVKFRYSLFAGPPPFEWIARKSRAVSADAITKWFARHLVIAKHDVERNVVIVGASLPPLKHFLACLHDAIESHESSIDRALYTKMAKASLACINN
uniref:EF-hand domain-containing protein n=1 Tax=Globisporangium ultimum (strain ATCC 200006 / CBS 805.95 / DAOM BR144) TaxID=431595 RepID=K3WC15_GLOUD